MTYHPAVEIELREIQQYYDKQSPGLGTQFIDEFDREVQPNAVPLRSTASVLLPLTWI